MARTGISKEQVFAAARRLEEAGKPVSARSVRELLGGTGSYSTISEYLKLWRNQHENESTEQLPAELEGNVVRLIRLFAKWLAQLVQRKVKQADAQRAVQMERIEAEVRKSTQEIAAIEAQCKTQSERTEDLERRLKAEEEAHHEAEKELSEAENRVTTLEDRASRLERRVSELERERDTHHPDVLRSREG